MKPTSISAEALFEAHRDAALGVDRRARPPRAPLRRRGRARRPSAADLVGYLNYIHPYRVQIVGRREVAYLLPRPRRKVRSAASRASSRWSRRC
jgi:HPr kinase/phosphorylase